MPNRARGGGASGRADRSFGRGSRTFRALIKQKRKSDPIIDEAQDGGRAIVVEEGLSAWIFTRAKELNYFAGQNGLSFDLLKTVRQFVSGYEVEVCPLSLWEMAIKLSIGKLTLAQPYDPFIPQQLALNDVCLLGITFEHTARIAALPAAVRD